MSELIVLCLVLASALIYVATTRNLATVRRTVGHTWTVSLLWGTIVLNWTIAFGVIFTVSSWDIPLTRPWMSALVVGIAFFLMFRGLRAVDAVERMRRIEGVKKDLDLITGRFLEQARRRIRTRIRSYPM